MATLTSKIMDMVLECEAEHGLFRSEYFISLHPITLNKLNQEFAEMVVVSTGRFSWTGEVMLCGVKIIPDINCIPGIVNFNYT